MDYKWVVGLFVFLWLAVWEGMVEVTPAYGQLATAVAVAVISFVMGEIYLIKFKPSASELALVSLVWMCMFVLLDIIVLAVTGNVFGQTTLFTNNYLLLMGEILPFATFAYYLRFPTDMKLV